MLRVFFSEKHIRTNLTWLDDEEKIIFYQKRIWQFESKMSNGSLTDEITNLNVIASVSSRRKCVNLMEEKNCCRL